MPEMRRLACPSCESGNLPLTVVDGIEEYRCLMCGLMYYGPCGCDTGYEAEATTSVAEKNGLGDDWQMLRVPAPAEGASAVWKYPGCS
jgi:hypothetical protein